MARMGRLRVAELLWARGGTAAATSNLNGKWGDTRYAKGPVWYQGYYDPLEGTQMMLRSAKVRPCPFSVQRLPRRPVSSVIRVYRSSYLVRQGTLATPSYQRLHCLCKGQVQPAKGQKSCTNCAVGKYTGASAK